jgi:hypothetical protein
MNHEQIARVCHEVNRAYCRGIGDTSQLAWDDAPDWQKQSAMLGVKLHTENPFAGEQASHDSWMAQKVAEGWVYGEVKDPDAKTHPCIVPFDQLPKEQQAKDYIFRAVVHALRPPHVSPTFGERAVGFTFNPSGDQQVAECKREFAAAIDRMNNFRLVAPSPESQRMASIAITEAQTAQMWAVKALTWRD